MLLQSATGITKCVNFITKCDRYYKVRQYMARPVLVRLAVGSKKISRGGGGGDFGQIN